MVVEADLRRPALSERLKVETDSDTGVSRILVGEATLERSLRRVIAVPSRNGKGPAVAIAGDLALVPSGPLPPSPQVLLNGRRLETLLGEARARSDTVIVDGPPMGVFSDMLPVAQRVDGVIVVVRLDHSRRDEIERFKYQLASTGIQPVGVVVLGADTMSAGYYYY